MTATTPTWGLRYPNDYQQPADSPSAFQQLATDTDAALTSAITVAWDGYYRDTNVALTAATKYNVLFESPLARPPGTIAAVDSADGSSGATIFTVKLPGLYLVEMEFSVAHDTVGKKSTFQMGMTRYGSHAGERSLTVGNENVTSGWPHVLRWSSIEHFGAWDGHLVFLQPVSGSATGWTLTYIRHTLTRIR